MATRISQLSGLLEFDTAIHVADIGAALLAETPVYAALVQEYPQAQLYSFDGDPRQIAALQAHYGDKATVLEHYVGDGEAHTAYVCEASSGMTSLFKPLPAALGFFNGFDDFGRVLQTETVHTTRLDAIDAIERIDFLKMDIQGSELRVLQHGREKLRECVAIQLEVSFIGLYEGQPTFGDIDHWMRDNGYLPHRFMDVKRWSISPTVRNKNFRIPSTSFWKPMRFTSKTLLRCSTTATTSSSDRCCLPTCSSTARTSRCTACANSAHGKYWVSRRCEIISRY